MTAEERLAQIEAAEAAAAERRIRWRNRVRHVISGPGLAMLVAGGALALAGGGLVEAAYGTAEVLGWVGVMLGKALAGAGFAVGARAATVAYLDASNEADEVLALPEVDGRDPAG